MANNKKKWSIIAWIMLAAAAVLTALELLFPTEMAALNNWFKNLFKRKAYGSDHNLGKMNYNPLNLRYRASDTWDGLVGNNKGFAQFTDWFKGTRACLINMKHQFRNGHNTVSGYISTESPPTENKTAKYIADVSKTMGGDISLDFNDKDTIHKFFKTLEHIELGSNHVSDEDFTHAYNVALQHS